MLDVSESGSSLKLSNNKATKTSIRCIFMTLKAVAVIGFCSCVVYIQCVGFGVARSDNLGNARASKRGTSNKRTPHAFCMYMNQPYLVIVSFGES